MYELNATQSKMCAEALSTSCLKKSTSFPMLSIWVSQLYDPQWLAKYICWWVSQSSSKYYCSDCTEEVWDWAHSRHTLSNVPKAASPRMCYHFPGAKDFVGLQSACCSEQQDRQNLSFLEIVLCLRSADSNPCQKHHFWHHFDCYDLSFLSKAVQHLVKTPILAQHILFCAQSIQHCPLRLDC